MLRKIVDAYIAKRFCLHVWKEMFQVNLINEYKKRTGGIWIYVCEKCGEWKRIET